MVEATGRFTILVEMLPSPLRNPLMVELVMKVHTKIRNHGEGPY